MAEKLNISQDISCESLISQYDMLLKRAEDISKRDKEFLSDNKTLIYNLQKKVPKQIWAFPKSAPACESRIDRGKNTVPMGVQWRICKVL